MSRREIINAAARFSRNYLEDKESGHGWWHIERVRRNALHIFKQEGLGDPFVIELAALLHDIGDNKIDPGTDGALLVRNFLEGIGVESPVIESVLSIMEAISFRDNIGRDHPRTPELDIVQDADRLDAIGAVGIARAFSYGGSKGHEIYNPDKSPLEYLTSDEYTSSDSSTINHFYEKLLRLKDLMNTETGSLMAERRHTYMEEYLMQFFNEWEGEL